MEIPELPVSAILLVEVGSTAHGTGLPGGEDQDELGVVVVESAAQVVGLDEQGFQTVMRRTQPDGVRSGPGDTDRTLHSLRRFIRLAASGNPSILMALWAPVLYSTPTGEQLQDLGDAFVGRHVIPRYRGYMQSQARRLLGLRGVQRCDALEHPGPEVAALVAAQDLARDRHVSTADDERCLGNCSKSRASADSMVIRRRRRPQGSRRRPARR